jgi:2-keto-4-pentenoate hydratase/2-oxohepta-3-ene-1,7-dioic acid hydratase in catechol pathway
VKLATFQVATDAAGSPLAGVIEGDRIRAFAHGTDGVRKVLAGTQDLASDLGSFALADVQLLAPIPHPGTIFAIGLNYRDHIAEMGHGQHVRGGARWPDRLPGGRQATRLRGRDAGRDRLRRQGGRLLRRQ